MASFAKDGMGTKWLPLKFMEFLRQQDLRLGVRINLRRVSSVNDG